MLMKHMQKSHWRVTESYEYKYAMCHSNVVFFGLASQGRETKTLSSLCQRLSAAQQNHTLLIWLHESSNWAVKFSASIFCDIL